MSTYYDRSGRQLTLDEWSQLMEDDEYKVVERTHVGPYLVSTVWLGLNHNWWGGPPLIFETMVFDQGPGTERPHHDHEMERYSTEAQARAGHDQMVAMVRDWPTVETWVRPEL